MYPPTRPRGFLPWLASGLGAAAIAVSSLAGADAAAPAGSGPPSDTLFGPPIGVPRDARSAEAAPTAPIPANWIDQSSEDAVSYTHLDVYKRQGKRSRGSLSTRCFGPPTATPS